MSEESKITALISLLDEPDKELFTQISKELIGMGNVAIKPLEHVWETALNDDIRDRVEDILRQIQIHNRCEEIQAWMDGEEQNMEDMFAIFSRIVDPNFDEAEMRITLGQLNAELWVELHENMTALEQVKVFNHFIFETKSFTVDRMTPFEMGNMFMHQVLQRKKGNDLTLGLLYLYFAKKNHISLYGVHLPQNFLVAYTTEEPHSVSDILFYINPFSNGIVFPYNDLKEFLKKENISHKAEYFEICTLTDIFKRWLRTLVRVYEFNGSTLKAEEVNIILQVFQPKKEQV